MILHVRIIRIDVLIYFLEIIIIIQIKQNLFDVDLLSIIIYKFKRKEKYFLILILKYKESNKLLNNLNHNFRLFIDLKIFYY